MKHRRESGEWPPRDGGQCYRMRDHIVDVVKRLLVRVVWYEIIKPWLPPRLW